MTTMPDKVFIPATIGKNLDNLQMRNLSQQEQDSFQRMIERIGHPVPGGIGNVDALREVMKHIQVLQGNFMINSDVDQPTTYRLQLPFTVESGDTSESIENTPKEEV